MCSHRGLSLGRGLRLGQLNRGALLSLNRFHRSTGATVDGPWISLGTAVALTGEIRASAVTPWVTPWEEMDEGSSKEVGTPFPYLPTLSLA